MNQRKILSLLMVACLCFTLTLACSGQSPSVIGNLNGTDAEGNNTGSRPADLDPDGPDKGLFGSARFGSTCFDGC